MQRDGQRIAEPDGAGNKQRGVAAEKEQRDVGALRGLQHKDRKKDEERRKPDAGAPLAGRYPHAVCVNSRTTMAKPAGFQMCLPSMRNTNLDAMAMTPASAGSHAASARSSRLKDNPVISGERRSILASRPDASRQLASPARTDRQRAVERLRAEIDPGKIDQQQRRERHDLKVARIGPPASHGRSLKTQAETQIDPENPSPLMLWNRDSAMTDRWPDLGNTITSLSAAAPDITFLLGRGCDAAYAARGYAFQRLRNCVATSCS